MVRCIHLLVDCAPLERQTAITAKSINIRLLWSQDIDSLRPSAVNNCVDSTRIDIILCDYLVRLWSSGGSELVSHMNKECGVSAQGISSKAEDRTQDSEFRSRSAEVRIS